jgi:hypothetical protein
VTSEPLPDPSEPLPDLVAEEPRRYPSTIGGFLYLGVLAATVVGVGIAWSGDWRLGVKWIGGALVAAGLLRLAMPQKDAGMLAVRHRAFDVLLLAGVGAALVFLSESIPNQPV